MAEFFLGGHWDSENGFQCLERVSPYPERLVMAEFCPICHLAMHKFNDGYRCLNYRAPEHRTALRGTRPGGARAGAGRKPKRKDDGKDDKKK